MLYLNRYKIDWATGKVERQETVFLHDPDKKVPFRIVHEDTDQALSHRRRLRHRRLPDRSATRFWIGDEFGPYILKADRSGKVLAVFETVADGKPVRSPDHCAVQSPGAPGASYTNVNLRRSKGYEGFASSKDGKFLYGLLEGPLWDAEKKDWEKGRRQGSLAHPRIRRRGGKVHRPLLAICVRAERQRASATST